LDESEVELTTESTGVCAGGGAEDVVGEGLIRGGEGVGVVAGGGGGLELGLSAGLETGGVGTYPSAGGDEVGSDAGSEVEVLYKG
jgi:hypothetical protein